MECKITTVSDLESGASAIDMHMLGDLEKIFDGGGNGKEPLCCVLKHTIAPWDNLCSYMTFR